MFQSPAGGCCSTQNFSPGTSAMGIWSNNTKPHAKQWEAECAHSHDNMAVDTFRLSLLCMGLLIWSYSLETPLGLLQEIMVGPERKCVWAQKGERVLHFLNNKESFDSAHHSLHLVALIVLLLNLTTNVQRWPEDGIRVKKHLDAWWWSQGTGTQVSFWQIKPWVWYHTRHRELTKGHRRQPVTFYGHKLFCKSSTVKYINRNELLQ